MGMIENMAYRRKTIVVMQLFYELKQQFPEIPDSVVVECMAKHNNDKEDCIKFLEEESRHYLHSHSFKIHSKSLHDVELHEKKVLMQSNDSNLTPNMPKRTIHIPNKSTIGDDEGIKINSISVVLDSEAPKSKNSFAFDSSKKSVSSKYRAEKSSPNLKKLKSKSNKSSRSSHHSHCGKKHPSYPQKSSIEINPSPCYSHQFSSQNNFEFHQGKKGFTCVNLQLKSPMAKSPKEHSFTYSTTGIDFRSDFQSSVQIQIGNSGASISAIRTSVSGRPPLPPSSFQLHYSTKSTHSSAKMKQKEVGLQGPEAEPRVYYSGPVSCKVPCSVKLRIPEEREVSPPPIRPTSLILPSKQSPTALSSEVIRPRRRSLPTSDLEDTLLSPSPKSHSIPNHVQKQFLHPHYSSFKEALKAASVLVSPGAHLPPFAQHLCCCCQQGLGSRLSHSDGDLLYSQGHFHYQFAKLESLRTIVINERRKFQIVESQVRHLRNVLYQRKVIRSTSLPLLEEKTRLMKEISEIRLNCHCLTHEADEILKGEVPLGETSEEFYNNIELNNNVESSLAPTSVGAIGGEPSTSVPAEVEEIEGPNWPCIKCTFLNHPALDRCEECEMPNIILGVAHKLEVCQGL